MTGICVISRSIRPTYRVLPNHLLGKFLRRSLSRGVSLVELLVVIVAIAVLVSIGLVAVRNAVPAASSGTAESNLAKLNRAILAYSQAASTIVLDPDDASADDEIFIIRSLQYHHPERLVPGAPFLSPQLGLEISQDADYRAVWNGVFFEMATDDSPGIDLLRLQESTAAPFDFPVGFQPVGANP
jgi:prepilin-type N-terminal cleavage/methylation domain-containing protein